MSATVPTFLFLIVIVVNGDVTDNRVDEACDLPSDLITEIQSYAPTVNKIIDSLTNGAFKGVTYDELAIFVDKFGGRLTGSQNLENSIDYMLELMEKYELENVHGENVTVPHWVRGEETATLLEPRVSPIAVLGLGYSVATPEDGIEAEVLVVRSFDELNQSNFSEAAKGKIVVFNHDFVSYGESGQYRGYGASRAAEHGAVAALIRSVTPFSLHTLHTGMLAYNNANGSKIPAACITVEDARMFQRMQDRGEKIVLRLNMQPQSLPDTTSRNTIGELVGSEQPEKIVVVSGHLDSWDVGVGAMDDGGGSFISWYALTVLKSLGLRPRRTIRAILWTGEEFGLLVGSSSYNATHYSELEDHTFVLDSDVGTFTPLGIEYIASQTGGCILQEIMKLLAPINATQAIPIIDEAGTGVLSRIGSDDTPWASLLNANERYFWYHHSAADTMDVEDPDSLDKSTALWASVAYVIADLSVEFPKEQTLKKIDN